MNKHEATKVRNEMEAAGYSNPILMNATYKDGSRGWEAITTDKTTGKPLRIATVQAWEKRKEVQP